MKKLSKFMVYALMICLAVTCVPPIPAAAATDTDELIKDAMEIERQANDGISGRLEGNVPDEFYGTSTAKKYTTQAHDSRFDGWTKVRGIDVSHHQGVIDWEKVAADGIEFAFIRVAGRGYGTAGTLFEDALYETNLKEAKAAGLDVGVYIYSQATTQKEAREEADYILQRIKGYEIDLPVVFDYEYYAGGRLANANLTDKQRTDICIAFCEAVKFAGYEPMIYANKSMLTDDLDAEKLSASYPIWLAHYTTTTDYQGTYSYWQYTSTGSVDGINGNVDRNWRYIEPGFRIGEVAEDSISMEWTPIADAEGYVIYRKTADAAYEIITQIDDPAVNTYTDTGLTTNTVYSYFVRYYKTDENGQQVIYKSGYPAKKAMTTIKLQQLIMTGTAVDAGTVKLSWAKEPNSSGYVLQQYDTVEGTFEDVATITDASSVVLEDGTEQIEYVHTDLQLGTEYQYRVCAFADVGGALIYGEYSEPATVTTASKLKKPVLTAKPYSYTTNKLSWEKVPGATGYQIQKYNYAKKKWVLLKTVTGGNTTSTSNTYLNCNTTYKYRVRAIAKLSGKTVYSAYSVAKTAKTKGSRIGVVKDGPLNIRTGPGTKYKKLIQVKKGRQLTVTGSTAKWYRVKIKVKGKYKVGYVSKTYVKLK